MLARRPLLRAFSLVYAVLQLLLPGAVSMADARLEAASIAAHPVAHVESHSTPACARVHPEDCALCRVISGGATLAGARPLWPHTGARVVPPAAAPSHIARRAIGAISARAPPVIA